MVLLVLFAQRNCGFLEGDATPASRPSRSHRWLGAAPVPSLPDRGVPQRSQSAVCLNRYSFGGPSLGSPTAKSLFVFVPPLHPTPVNSEDSVGGKEVPRNGKPTGKNSSVAGWHSTSRLAIPQPPPLLFSSTHRELRAALTLKKGPGPNCPQRHVDPQYMETLRGQLSVFPAAAHSVSSRQSILIYSDDYEPTGWRRSIPP